jgi:formate dehydrogenase major subunit
MADRDGQRSMGWSDRLPPLLRQVRDPLGLGRAARSRRSSELRPRIADADTEARSLCP